MLKSIGQSVVPTLLVLIAGLPAILHSSTSHSQPAPQRGLDISASQGPAIQAAPRLDDSRWRKTADQAEALLDRGDYVGAERVAADVVEEARRTFGENHVNMGVSLTILGTSRLRQGRFAEAEDVFRQVLTLYERRSGQNSIGTASALNNLALVLERRGDYPGAEGLLRRAHGILVRTLGLDHVDTATAMSNLARVLDSQGKFGAGSELIAGGKPEGGAVTSKNPVAQKVSQSRAEKSNNDFGEAETLHDRVLAIYERAYGVQHPLTATALSNVGNARYLQGKFADAEAYHRRALAIREKVLGPEHPDIATSLNNLANVMAEQGKDTRSSLSEQRTRASLGQRVQAATEVEGLFRRALRVQESALGPDHAAVANTLNNFAAFLDQQGKSPEAELLQRRALAILDKTLGPLHPDTASTLTTLAVSLDRQDRIVDSEKVYRQAVETSRAAGNPRTLLLNASRLGYALAKRGRLRDALPFYRESIDTLDRLYVRTRGLSDETRQAFLGQFGSIYLETIRLLLQLHRIAPKGGYDRQILEVASRNQSRVFTELMRIADVARFSDEPDFLELRGRRAALTERIDETRQTLVTLPPGAVGGDQRKTDLSAQMAQAARELESVEARLSERYPRFMELTSPRPVAVEDLQKVLLRPGEALLTYVLLPQETIVFAITNTRIEMHVSQVRREDVARRIHGLRRTIEKVTSGESVLFLREIDPGVLQGLYRDLIEPVSDVLAGSEKVFVVGDGPLHTIPFELLVSRWSPEDQQAFRAARSNSDGSESQPYLSEYRLLEYAGKRFRFAYLPSLSALASQRLYPKAIGVRTRELVAFADPDFTPDGGKQFPPQTRAYLDALGDQVPRSREGVPQIPRLRETEEEAREISRILGGDNILYVGADAQERSAKRADLKSARFLLFATHGLLGGEFLHSASAVGGTTQKSVAQPALVLSLVGELGGEDGLLTMKEVIEDLELNADVVALSACNTAGESIQANNGEGFAGLTRAFMYAGAKSLIVSHWSVDSLSTQALMTNTFGGIQKGVGTLAAMSEAQRAMLSGTYAAGNFHVSRSHPFFWAPFVYVGD